MPTLKEKKGLFLYITPVSGVHLDHDSRGKYRTKRDGILLLTQKRLLVVDRGTTSVRYSNLADIDYDLDLDLIVISKSNSGRPVFLRTESPVYTARAIDLLTGSARAS